MNELTDNNASERYEDRNQRDAEERLVDPSEHQERLLDDAEWVDFPQIA